MWKVFRIGNITEIIVIVSLFGYGIYQNPLSFKNSDDIIVSIFLYTIPLGAVLNSIHNLILLSYKNTGKKLSLRRKIFFWCVLIFFIGVVCLISYGVFSSYSKWKFLQSGKPQYSKDIIVKMLLVNLAGLVFVLNGIYIICAQISLFFRLKRDYELSSILLIDEIGKAAAE